MTIEPTASLASIAIGLPMSTGIFRKYDLDFCCGGKQSLKDACAERGIPLIEIVSQLEALEVKTSPIAEESAGGITDYIVTRYHDDLRGRLPELLKLAEKVNRAHKDSPHHSKNLTSLLRRFTEEMFEHMLKEEQILFPLIRSGQSAMVKMPINRMELEHDEHGHNLRAIKKLSNNFVPPPGACPTWKALYRGLEELEAEVMDHINLENNILFPKALDTLKP